MGKMLNNTNIKVTFPLEKIIQLGYKELCRRELAPYTHPNVPIDYSPIYALLNKENKMVTNVRELTVSFELIPNKKEEPKVEKPYEAGDWRDPEVDTIINQKEG